MQLRTKKGILFSFLVFLSMTIIVSQVQNPSEFQAEATTLQVSLADGVWTDVNGQTNTYEDVSKAPFSIFSNGYEFLLSTGFFQESTQTAYLGTINALTTSNYYNLTKHPSLSGINALTSYNFEAALWMNTDLWNVELNSITLSWVEKSNDIYALFGLIYSLDGGTTWNLDNSTQKTNLNDGVLSATFDVTNFKANRLRVGVLMTKASNTNGLYVTNPELSILYQSLSDQEIVSLLTSEVLLYTPCETDEMELILITEFKKADFLEKYSHLSYNAQLLFQNEPLGDGFSAYERYLFLIHERI